MKGVYLHLPGNGPEKYRLQHTKTIHALIYPHSIWLHKSYPAEWFPNLLPSPAKSSLPVGRHGTDKKYPTSDDGLDAVYNQNRPEHYNHECRNDNPNHIHKELPPDVPCPSSDNPLTFSYHNDCMPSLPERKADG